MYCAGSFPHLEKSLHESEADFVPSTSARFLQKSNAHGSWPSFHSYSNNIQIQYIRPIGPMRPIGRMLYAKQGRHSSEDRDVGRDNESCSFIFG